MPYIGTQPKDVRSFGRAQFDFTATQGQTAFSGQDDDGKYLGFTEGQIQVYVNGILMDASDYTTSNTNTVTLVSSANLNDIITVVALQTDIPNSDYVPISGGTFTGDVTHSGDVTFSGSIDGNLGIGGTAVPSTSGYDTATLHLRQAGSSSVGSQLRFSNGASGHTSSDGGHISYWFDKNFYLYNAEAGSFRFYTSATERMKIDSSGRVTMPYQPSFQVQLNSQANVGSGGYVTGWGGIYNTGSHFANDRFTAPVAGKYLISYSGLHNTSSGYYGRAYLYKNGSSIFDGLGDQQTYASYQRLSWSIIVNLSASDYLQIYANSNNSSHYVYSHYTHWSGHLLG